MVLEQLAKGPMEEGHYAVIPEKSVILSATIADRICYINMNRAFQEEALDVSESIQIYSVVNSLLDSCEADKVQLSVEGSMDGNLRSSMPLYTFYEKNDQLVVQRKRGILTTCHSLSFLHDFLWKGRHMARRPVCLVCLFLMLCMCLADLAGIPLIRGNPLPETVQTYIKKHPDSVICGEVQRCQATEFSFSVYLKQVFLICRSEKNSH